MEKTGIPPGVVNMIHGDREIVDLICENKSIKTVSFVGSTTAGEDIYRKASYHGKRV